MNVLYLLYFAVGGLITMGVLLLVAVFFLKRMQKNNDRQRQELEARAALQTAVEASRTFAPHG